MVWAVAAALMFISHATVAVPGRAAMDLLAEALRRPGILLAAFSSHACSLLAALVLAGLFLAPGAGLARWLGVGNRGPVLGAAFGFPLGYAAFSFSLLGLLLVRLWFPPVLWAALLLAAAGAGLRGVPDVAAALGRARRPAAPATAALVSMVLFLPWLVSPEIHTDGYEYFLAGASLWLREHGLYVRHVVSAMHYPSLVELPYAMPLLLHAESVPKWWQVAWLGCGLAATARSWDPDGRGWGSLGVVSCAALAGFIGTGKNDGSVVGLALLSFAAVTAGGSRAWMLLGGVFAGLACCVKYVGALDVVWVPVAVLCLNRWRWRAGLGSWAAAAVGFGVPWYLKSWLLTGDPFWPALSGLLPGILDGWDHRNAEVWRNWMGFRGMGEPFLSGYLRYLARENVAFLWALPVALLTAVRVRVVVAAALLTHAALFAAFYNPQADRWFIGTLAPAVFLTVSAVSRRGLLARSVLAILLVLATAHRVSLQEDAGVACRYFLGTESRDGVVREVFGTYDEAARFLARLPGSGGVLAEGEIHSYRMTRPFIVGTTINIADAPLEWKLAVASRTSRELRKKCRQLDARFILHNPVRSQNSAYLFAPFVWTGRMLAVQSAFYREWTELVYRAPRAEQRNGLFYVYRVLDLPGPSRNGPLWTLPGCESLFVPALEELRRGNPRRAAVLCRSALGRLPPVYQAMNVAAGALRQAGRPGEACALYRPGISAGMIDDVNVIDYAWASFDLGRFDEAIRCLRRASGVYPDWRDKSVMALHDAMITAVAQAVRTGRLAGADLLAREGLAEPLFAALPDVSRRTEWRAEFRAARAAIAALQGRRAEAEREILRLGSEVPSLKGLTLDEVLRRLKSARP
jgi:hypothetical protein